MTNWKEILNLEIMCGLAWRGVAWRGAASRATSADIDALRMASAEGMPTAYGLLPAGYGTEV